MEARVERMGRVCRQYNGALSNKNKPYSNRTLMWDVDHKLLYCPLYKVASGTWTTNFLRLAKYNEDLPNCTGRARVSQGECFRRQSRENFRKSCLKSPPSFSSSAIPLTESFPRSQARLPTQ